MTRKCAVLLAVAMTAAAGTVWAKLPAPPPMTGEQKAKADAAAAAKAEAAKKEATLLTKYQDRAADNYKKGQGRARMAAPAKSKK